MIRLKVPDAWIVQTINPTTYMPAIRMVRARHINDETWDKLNVVILSRDAMYIWDNKKFHIDWQAYIDFETEEEAALFKLTHL